jgi:hypothetical protein
MLFVGHPGPDGRSHGGPDGPADRRGHRRPDDGADVRGAFGHGSAIGFSQRIGCGVGERIDRSVSVGKRLGRSVG